MNFKKAFATIALTVMAGTAVTGCSEIKNTVDSVLPSQNETVNSEIVKTSGDPVGLGLDPSQRAENYFEKMGAPVFTETCSGLGNDEYNYTGVINNAGQVGSACGVITTTHERVDPVDDPAGYDGNNKKVSIPSTKATGKAYNGYFYNRSHMIGAALGGSPTKQNLITGTRMQNVGESNKGGMRYTEAIAEKYLKSGKGETCPLTYEVTPHYNNTTDAVPTWVEVNMQNCDGTVAEHVATFNDAKGYTIDYATGAFTANK